MRLWETLLYSSLAAVVTCIPGDDGSIDGLVADKPTAASPCGEGSNYVNMEIITSAERDLMAECTEINKLLWISKDYPGIFSLPKLRNVTGIYLGDPTDDDSGMITGQLTGASFPELIYASEIRAVNLENIASIDVPKLAYNDYELQLVGLPSLESYNGFESIRTTQWVTIERTGLSKIEYNSVEYINKMEITNNPSLRNVELPAANISWLLVDCSTNQLPRFSGPANAVKLSVTSCSTTSNDPSTAFGIKTMVGETREDYLYVEPNFEFEDNSFSSIGFPNLTRIDGQLDLSNNANLSGLYFPALTVVNGGLGIEGTQELHAIDKTMFPVLANVSDHLRFLGDFSDITLPDTLENAPVIISSTNYHLNCSKYEKYAVPSVDVSKTGIQVQCSVASEPSGIPYAGGSSGSSGGGSSSSNSDHSQGPHLRAGTIAGIVIGSVSALASFCLIILLTFRRTKKNLRRQEAKLAQREADSQLPLPQPVQPASTFPPGQPDMPWEKPELAAIPPHADTSGVAVVPMPEVMRERELDARERAIEERERELAARETRSEAHELQ